MYINNINSVNFSSALIKYNMSIKDGRALSEAVREYARTSSEKARLRAFDVFDKYMVKDAENETKNGYLYEDYLQKLRLNFLEKLEYFKNRADRISISIARSMDWVLPSDEDKMLSDIDDGVIKTVQNLYEYEVDYTKHKTNTIDENEFNDYALNIINNKILFSEYQREVLKLYICGYSLDDIADKFCLSKERVRQILEEARIIFVIESNLKPIQESIRAQLSSAFEKNGCTKDENGKYQNVDKLLDSKDLYETKYHLSKNFAEGESLRNIYLKNTSSYISLYEAFKKVLKALDKDAK